jgi:hypothetical protein
MPKYSSSILGDVEIDPVTELKFYLDKKVPTEAIRTWLLLLSPEDRQAVLDYLTSTVKEVMRILNGNLDLFADAGRAIVIGFAEGIESREK